MSKSSELKHLQVRADKLNNELSLLKSDMSRIGKEITTKNNQLLDINNKIKNFSNSTPIVTEHAMLRYIERVLGVDLNKVTNDILTEQNIKMIEFAGNCNIKSNGVEFIVKDRKVISVVVD